MKIISSVINVFVNNVDDSDIILFKKTSIYEKNLPKNGIFGIGIAQ